MYNISSDIKFLELEISRFLLSRRRKNILDAQRYFNGFHDILSRKREVIGVDGKIDSVENLPNNKIIDNQFKKMVNQKSNYLLGKPLAFNSSNRQYSSSVSTILNRKFNRLLKCIGQDTLIAGVGWLFLSYDANGELSFRRLDPLEVIPGWSDADHTSLDYLIRVYNVTAYEGIHSYTEKVLTKVELFDSEGIHCYSLENNKLIPEAPYHQNYFSYDGVSYNWNKIPVIPFKFNDEIPLLNCIRSLQDGLNLINSNFLNHMLEDQRNTILVLVNYDGENLGEFRKNLAQYGAVKVNTVDKAPGDVRSLHVEVNSDNYKAILEIFKKAIIENSMGYDAKDDRLSGAPNQLNIMSMYSDIDLDANSMETEFQASFDDLFWFLDNHFYNFGIGDFFKDTINVIFNRDILINESEVIDMCVKSSSLLSTETIISNHPWVDDINSELEQFNSTNSNVE